MKKLAAMLAIMLALLCSAALGEEATTYTYDMGDFTIDLPEGIYGGTNEKADGAMRLVVFPDYQAESSINDNLNLIWQNRYVDTREADVDAFTASSIETIKAQMEAEGVELGEIQVQDAGTIKLDGMRGLYYLLQSDYGFDAEEGRVNVTLYTKTCMFSDEYLGTYVFTMTARDMDAIQTMQAMIDTIRWN